MENLKENVKEIEKIKKENYKIKENIQKLENEFVESYRTHDQKEILENEERQKKIKSLKNKIELNKIKVAILKNNIHYLFKNNFENSELKEKIIYIYENKNIGPVTKEKIENEIKTYFKEKYNVNISCYLSSEYNGISLNFGFLDNNGYRNFILEYNEEFKITFAKHSYNNYELQVLYYNTIVEYIEIKDLKSKASELLKEYNKTKEKIEKLRLQQKELYHNFKDYIHGFVYNELEIDTNIRIY